MRGVNHGNGSRTEKSAKPYHVYVRVPAELYERYVGKVRSEFPDMKRESMNDKLFAEAITAFIEKYS